MKTLKEILSKPTEQEITIKEVIESVKEWLTQKRQDCPHINMKQCPKFNELLDSLESPTGEELQEE